MPLTALRCSLRLSDHGSPVTVGFPFAKLTVEPGRLTVTSHRRAGRFSVTVNDVAHAQRTPHGVRVHAAGGRTFIVGHPRPSRVVTALKGAGVQVNETISAVSWTDV